MDVRCERCNTEYEFDDALVSGRGTTVKCTNCGHKFKIRRSDGDFSEDFWNVQTNDGRTLVFTSLRELQRAIQTNLVDRHDLLSRGGLKQKAIGQIPELAPFFDQRDAQQQKRSSLPPPVAAPAIASRPPPVVSGTTGTTAGTPPPPPRQRMSTRPDFPPPSSSPLPAPPPAAPPAPPAARHVSSPGRAAAKTLIGTGDDDSIAIAAIAASAVPATPAMRERLGSLRPNDTPPVTEREIEPDTERFEREAREAREHGDEAGEAGVRGDDAYAAVAAADASVAPVVQKPPLPKLSRTDPMLDGRLEARIDRLDVRPRKHTPAPPPFEASSPLPPPTAPVLRTMNLDSESHEYSDGVRGRSPSLPDGPASMGRRRSVGGFIVAAVVVAGVALIAVVWARDHLGGALGGKPPRAATTDPRVSDFLAAGEKALTDGNLELAKEKLDKASALAERDPRVLIDLARLAALRADTPWLKTRLLSADAADEHRLTKDNLTELSAAARKAADDALFVAPEDQGALRAKIDALRIAGDRDGARALVARVVSSASQPETAYVLAALDLAENEPLWSTVLERLRAAASIESGPGRARAALAYALARSGDGAAAKAEVERLAGMSRQHSLVPLLRAFADRAPSRAVGAVDAGLPDAAIAMAHDAGKHGDHGGDHGDPRDPREPREPRDPGDKRGLSSDARQLVAQAEKARAKGDLDRAQTLYAAALERNANDTEALSGLATIAHSRRDLNGARASYKRVLSLNPSYVPALVGVADVDWESGDRATAMKTYKEIVDRFPEGTYPARVKQRLDSGSGGSGSAPTPATPPTTTPTPPAPAPAPAETGGGG